MTVLVAGAAGFIGTYIRRAAMARGGKLVGLDNDSCGAPA